MATSTMGTTSPLGKRNVNRGVYWAIAAVVAVILALAFVASRDRNTTAYESTTPGINTNMNTNSTTPSYNTDGTMNSNATMGTTDTMQIREANSVKDPNPGPYQNSPAAGPETPTDSRSTTERPQQKR